MKVYMIAHIEVTNLELMQKYRELVPKIIEKFNGKYIVRGGDLKVLEGNALKHRMVVVEFPNKESAENFYYSEEYAPVKSLRLEAGNNSSVLVEGLE
ncbi:MAG: D-fructose-6-phosphate amidotransferase [Pelagibacterales bacterium]|nr:D-fructose-6-phosphate amidotransferase [Pelagibacterales bacterium]|tara:strand:+ start:1307 stop:1597 length:291 start_codon:yes stop_codon:yes gene_type:complete